MKPRHQPNGASEDIMADIEQTRANMDDTLDQLSERLQPRHLLDDLLDYWHSRRQSGRSGAGKEKMKRAAGQVRHSAGEAGRTLVHQLQQHPVPALLIGAGIAWLLTERNQEEEYEVDIYEEDYGETAYEEGMADMQSGPGPETYALPSHYGEQEESGGSGIMGKMKEKGARLKGKAGEKWQQAREGSSRRTEEMRRRARERGAYLKEQARHGYYAGMEKMKQTTDDYPLAVGAGCLALGVVAGMLIPSTRKEDEWVGPARDRLMRRSKEAARDAVERGKHVAQAAADAAKTQAQEQGLTPQALKEKASHVVEAARATAQTEGITPATMKEKAQTAVRNVKEETAQEARHQKDEMKSNR